MARDNACNDHGFPVDGFCRHLWNGHDIARSSWRVDWVELLSDLHHRDGKRLRLDCRRMEGSEPILKNYFVERLTAAWIRNRRHYVWQSLKLIASATPVFNLCGSTSREQE